MLDVQLDEVNQAAAEEKAPEFGVHLDIASYGDMSSFFWAHSQAPPPGLIECNVAYGRVPPPCHHALIPRVPQPVCSSASQCL